VAVRLLAVSYLSSVREFRRRRGQGTTAGLSLKVAYDLVNTSFGSVKPNIRGCRNSSFRSRSTIEIHREADCDLMFLACRGETTTLNCLE
jgi:hypothetical protein